MKNQIAQVLVFVAVFGAVVGCQPSAKFTAPEPSAWRTEGKVYYSNVYMPDAGSIHLPYVLGGTDVQPPSAEALASYQKAGYLTDVTLDQLTAMYRAEGLTWTFQDEKTLKAHVLEGGTSLIAPPAGTTGFARIFGQPHPPYAPKSKELKEYASRIKSQLPVMASNAPGKTK